MSELLDLANDLMAAREWAPNGGDWEPFTGPYEYADYALAVIQGYQDLLRRIVETFDDREPGKYGDLVGMLLCLVDEARESIPEKE